MMLACIWPVQLVSEDFPYPLLLSKNFGTSGALGDKPVTCSFWKPHVVSTPLGLSELTSVGYNGCITLSSFRAPQKYFNIHLF